MSEPYSLESGALRETKPSSTVPIEIKAKGEAVLKRAMRWERGCLTVTIQLGHVGPNTPLI